MNEGSVAGRINFIANFSPLFLKIKFDPLSSFQKEELTEAD